jgi:hypothetical protein
MTICETCLKAPICRHKGYRSLIRGCKELSKILYFRGCADMKRRKQVFNTEIQEIENHLKPTQWRIEYQKRIPIIKVKED